MALELTTGLATLAKERENINILHLPVQVAKEVGGSAPRCAIDAAARVRSQVEQLPAENAKVPAATRLPVASAKGVGTSRSHAANAAALAGIGSDDPTWFV
jgi:hypothetical protein